jgi:uncharacterized protein YqhQ
MDLSNYRCGGGFLFLVVTVGLPFACSIVWRRGSSVVIVERKEKRVRMIGGVSVLVFEREMRDRNWKRGE